MVLIAKNARIVGAPRVKLSAELARKYKGGHSIRAIAADTGRSYGFVHRMLSDAGVRLRARGGSNRKRQVVH